MNIIAYALWMKAERHQREVEEERRRCLAALDDEPHPVLWLCGQKAIKEGRP